MVNYTPYYKSDSIGLIRRIIEGQIVDAVIMPVAPHAAVIPGKYYHTGKARPSPSSLISEAIIG